MADDAPEISVVIPCYNQACYLPHALDSVTAQEGVKVQVIVVDDGSPDDVETVCRRYGPAVTYFRQENSGVSAARNAGIELAEGEFLHFLDADDAIKRGMYAAMVRSLRANPEWTAVVCRSRYANADCEPYSAAMEPPPVGCPFESLAAGNLFPNGAVVLRRSILDRTGVFDTTLRMAEDWDLWLRIARTGAVFGSVKESYFLYRIRPGGRSRDPVANYNSFREIISRARRPDPRVKDPAPQYADGVSPSDLEERMAEGAALTLGKAIGIGNIDAALETMDILLSNLNGRPHSRTHCVLAFNEAATTRGILPPTSAEVSRQSWLFLARLATETGDNPAAQAFLVDLVAHFFGKAEWEDKTERLEHEWEQKWKQDTERLLKRYSKLAGKFPTNICLWLRRKVRGKHDL